MKALLTPGIVTGALACASALAGALGYKPLGAFLSDPTTAASAQALVTAVLSLAAGFLQGVRRPNL